MKKIRFLLALWVAKFAIMGLQLLRRNATHYPGVVALKICPDFLKMLQKPQTIIGVTGTNGKTTVANLTTDLLTHQGKKVLSNRMGGNILGGITTVLIRGVNVFGKSQYPMAVLEMDERSSRLVLPFVQPDFSYYGIKKETSYVSSIYVIAFRLLFSFYRMYCSNSK
jgi:hypothetical protein